MITQYWEDVNISPLWYIDTSERFFLWLFLTILHALCWFMIFVATCCMDVSELLGFKEVVILFVVRCENLLNVAVT